MKKYFAVLMLALLTQVLLSSNNSHAKVNTNPSSAVSSDRLRTSQTQNAALDSVVNYLLDVSAKDFYEHQPPVPAGFRNVQIKYLLTSNEEKVYLLCGEFLEQANEKWTSFATIKTSGYEQWIGANATAHCQDSKTISSNTNDLSSELKSRFDSLQNLTR